VGGKSAAKQFEKDMIAAGMLGYESVHANFESTSVGWATG